MKNGSIYALAFTRGGHPSKLVNIPFFPTPAAAKTAERTYRRKAIAEGKESLGVTWDYAAVEIKPLR